MTAIREFMKVKDHQLHIRLPDDFDYEEVEVIIIPKSEITDDFSSLEDEITKGMDSGVSTKTHGQIISELKSKYA